MSNYFDAAKFQSPDDSTSTDGGEIEIHFDEFINHISIDHDIVETKEVGSLNSKH